MADAVWKKLAYEDDVILKALLTATGDILYASGAGTPAALPIGTDEYVLTVATDIPAWEAPAAPAAHHLNDHTAADGAVDFNLNIATDLVIMTVAAEANLPKTPSTSEAGMPCWATSEKTLHICTTKGTA
jgi:hypothetical protein